jgi:hypothetical protein
MATNTITLSPATTAAALLPGVTGYRNNKHIAAPLKKGREDKPLG